MCHTENSQQWHDLAVPVPASYHYEHACLQNGKQSTIPSLDELLAPDSDSEEEPDLELQLPANKVKYMVGQGGDKIKYIQRKTKCRIQVTTLDADQTFCRQPVAMK